ncbi:MAG: zinc-binding dehydrogenase [Dehalococcoidales bacterium]|nr:zinc-binding dehydrogenase [Dehalococcoidales bacterium]
MKAIRVQGNKQIEVIEVPDPQPKDDLVVVKIMASTICGTEHTYYEGKNALPTPGGTGHEGAGIVWKTDKTKNVKEGDHVTIYPTIWENCHRCLPCWNGEWQRCENPKPKRSYIGTHSQYMLVPEYVCLPIPQEMPFGTAAMIDDCLGTPYRALKRLGLNARDTVFITGAGPIGMSALMVAKFHHARVMMVDTNEYRLQQASVHGADFIFNPAKDNVLAKVKEITGKKGCDIAIDCSGVDVAQIQCLEAVGGGGRVAFIGIRSVTTPINAWKHLMAKEVTLIGSWASTPQDHTELVNMLQRGMPAGNIITDRFSINAANEAFAKFFGGTAVKVAITPWDE